MIAQSFAPTKKPRSDPPKPITPPSIFVSGWGAAHGYHTAPVKAGPAVPAGTSKNRTPAAWASVAVKQSAAASMSFDGRMDFSVVAT
jgi:hypothetical protein